MTAGLVLVAAPASVAAGQYGGKQTVCVSGTQGNYARLVLLDDDRHVIKTFHLRKGCVVFRLGEDLPAGQYRIKHRAPQGRLTGLVEQSGGREYPDGGATSGTSREREVRLKKVKSAGFALGDPWAFGAITFQSVKNRHR